MNDLHEKNNSAKEKVYFGAITIFYKQTATGPRFLIAQNKGTGITSFVSGAQEDEDQSLEETARRENLEELGLDPTSYTLTETDVKHEFVFGPQKKERAGCRGSYHVFVSDLTHSHVEISPTKELNNAQWMTQQEANDALSFPDVKEVFDKSIKAIK